MVMPMNLRPFLGNLCGRICVSAILGNLGGRWMPMDANAVILMAASGSTAGADEAWGRLLYPTVVIKKRDSAVSQLAECEIHSLSVNCCESKRRLSAC